MCWGSTFYANRTSEPSAVKRDLQRLSTGDPVQVTTVVNVLRLRLPLFYAVADAGWEQRGLNNEDLGLGLKINGDLRLNNRGLMKKSDSLEGL